MEIKRIDDSLELDHFRKLTNKYIHVLFPLEYLQRSKVFACYDNKKRICGGFVLVMKGPFRVLDSIPNNYEVPLINLERTCEVTGLWFIPSAKDRSNSFSFWVRLYWELLLCRKDNFVYAFSMSNPHIGKMYEPARPIRLFKGKTQKLIGMEEEDDEVVEYIKKFNLYFFPLRSPDFFVKRVKHNFFQKMRKMRFYFKKQYV